MSLAALVFSSWNWLGFVAGALAIALAVLIWNYRSTRGGPVRWVCMGLKLLGFAALGLCLLEPLWSGQRARPGGNMFAVVADNSQGLTIKDKGETRTRGEVLRGLLDTQHGAWQSTLEENFDVRRYYFDARLQTTKDFSELVFDGRSSAIGATLYSLAERYRGRPLAGILLLTDGNATDIRGAPDLTGLPPIYPVILGRTDPIRDLSVQSARVNQTAFEDAPVSVQADVQATGFTGEKIVAQLTDRSGKKIAEQTLHVARENETLAFRFQLKPETAGLSFYRFRVGAENQLDAAAGVNVIPEATLANNDRILTVNRGRGPYRILYVSGRPNWEFKFLNRAVHEDDQLELAALIRVAKREPKFNFLGRVGETSNPLFRGFGTQSAEDVERFDQPVLVRLNTRDDIELRTGFPRTAEELYDYYAIIVDDLEAEFFTPDQAALLQKFVSERGGGFLMLGGMECFQQGHYLRTPIGDMLPVYLDRTEEGKPGTTVRLNLTKEGLLQSWARLRDNEGDEQARIKNMAPFHVLNRVREVKPGASIVANVQDESGKTYPALVVQRFGRGRTAALTIGDVWHWGLHDAEAHADMDKAWRQLMRWLVTDAPNRVDMAIEPQPDNANGAVSIQVRARDQKFQPLDNAGVSIDVQPLMASAEAGTQTNSIRLQAEPSQTEPGLYEVSFVPRFTAGYKASAFVTNSAGIEVGRSEAGWSTDLAADEFKSLQPNTALLEIIAKRTGGEVIEANKLEDFARSLPHRHAPVMEVWTSPLWHTPSMFAFALICFISEWGLRRWKGMA